MARNNRWNFDTTYSIGDLLYANSTSGLLKLNVGSANEFLKVSAGLPAWGIVNGGGSQSSQTFTLFSECDAGRVGDQNAANGPTGFAYQPNGQSPDSGHPGVLELSTGSSSTATNFINFFYALSLGQGTYSLDILAKIPTLSTAAQRFNIYIGFMDNFAPANGCYFYYRDNVNSGRWQIKNTASSTTTTANTVTTVDTNWHKFSIRVNAAATSVGYFIDDVQVSNSPLTTNIPTSLLSCGCAIDKDVGTTARTILMDYVQLDISLTSDRT